MRLAGEVALVTGGSGGIGRAICAALAGAGAIVALHYHQRAELAEKVAGELRDSGGKAELYQADLRVPRQAQALVDQVLSECGRLDILINNAGVTLGGKETAAIAPAEWLQIMDINLNSVFYLCRAAVPPMRRQRGGKIVNIASNIVNSLPGGSAAYAASKAGLVALTKVLSKEEARHGIRVNAVSPGIIRAGMGIGALERRPPAVREQFLATIPMGRPGEAGEVAAAVLFLVSDQASYITGQHLTVNGGDRTESYQ
jgi:3-oxoacyl-[acyl-carrier protein] reductase